MHGFQHIVYFFFSVSHACEMCHAFNVVQFLYPRCDFKGTSFPASAGPVGNAYVVRTESFKTLKLVIDPIQWYIRPGRKYFKRISQVFSC